MVTTFNPTIIMLKHIICIAGLALALASCEKIEKVEAPVFSVTTEKDTYAAGESVKFFFHGNPDIISCYTGELGNNYDYTDGRIAEPDFLITFDQQHIDGQQLDQFHVLVSKNFDEDYSYEGITASDVESSARTPTPMSELRTSPICSTVTGRNSISPFGTQPNRGRTDTTLISPASRTSCSRRVMKRSIQS